MNWNATENELLIEWLEVKNDKTEYHSLKKSPLRLQLHPTTGGVLRAYIKGARPAWVVRYAKENKYNTNETTTKEGKGWWIANWSQYRPKERPLLCPFIKGMIEEWFEKVHESCQADKENLLSNLDVVEINLLYHADKFTEYGLHFRAEEILLDGGALLVDSELLPTHDDEGGFHISNWASYTKVIKELLELRDIPDNIDVKARFDEVEEDSFVLELPLKSELVSSEDEEDFLVSDITIPTSLGDVDEEFTAPLVVLEEEEEELELELELPNDVMELESYETEPIIIIDEPHEEVEELVIELTPTCEEIIVVEENALEPLVELEDTQEELTVNMDVPIQSIETENTNATEPLQEKVSEVKLKVADKVSKKEGIVVGQTLLF